MACAASSALLLLGAVAPPAAAARPWVAQPHPDYGGQEERLADVVAFAENDVWAVGNRYIPLGGTYEFRTHVLHFDGSTSTVSPARDVEGPPATNFLVALGGPRLTSLAAR